MAFFGIANAETNIRPITHSDHRRGEKDVGDAGVRFTPTTIPLDRDKKFLRQITGSMESDDSVNTLRSLL